MSKYQRIRAELAQRYKEADAASSEEDVDSTAPGTSEAHQLNTQASLSVGAVKERLKNLRRTGNPLGILAQKEAALHENSRHLQELSAGTAGTKNPPDPQLLVRQLSNTTNVDGNSNLDREARREVMRLYNGLNPQDAEDSLLVRGMIALSNTGMACLERGMRSGNPQARDLNLRYGIRALGSMADLMRMRDSRLGRIPAVNVGDVKIEAGGQAIVGQVKVEKRRSRTRKKSGRLLRATRRD